MSMIRPKGLGKDVFEDLMGQENKDKGKKKKRKNKHKKERPWGNKKENDAY